MGFVRNSQLTEAAAARSLLEIEPRLRPIEGLDTLTHVSQSEAADLPI